jgi:sugar/nucleoside kinase (ribokinase family)
VSEQSAVELTVVGSINLDFTARLERLPRPGETLTAHQLVRSPGGKGANQAAARLVAQVTMVGAVGDAFTAALVVMLLEGASRERALQVACAAGAWAASVGGAQPSLPRADEVALWLD